MEKTGAKARGNLTSLSRDFRLNSKYCGKPVKGFICVKDHFRVIWRKIGKQARGEVRRLL